jgi:hypothetical protein
MLGTQPPPSADELLRAPWDVSRSVALVTMEMMWAVALATTRASVASTARGLALWSRMLHAPIGSWLPIASPIVGPSGSDGNAAGGAASQETTGNPVLGGTPSEGPATFASYRSSGGHAAAQVITHH